ncbi:MAG: hypothetical protein K6F16_05570 [Lachnospiraceae bacterium]|nr:hypothetical protein [Lachnospiraceae bacterium]
MKNGLKRVIAALLMLTLALGIVGIRPATKTEAAAKVKRSEFIVLTVKAMQGHKNAAGKTIDIVLNKDGSAKYAGKTIKAATVNKLKSKYGVTLETAQYLAIGADMGIFKTSAKAYKSKKAMAKKMTYKVALALLVKADSYLYGTKFSSADVKLAKSRISNIKKAGTTAYQEYVTKAFMLGLYVGTKDGYYKTTRTLKYGTTYTKSAATKLIAKLVDPSKRSGITDDYQVIRTTKLPKTADQYPYILENYPNAYYDTAWTNYGGYVGGTDPSDINNNTYYIMKNTDFNKRLQNKGAYYNPEEFLRYAAAGDNECVVPSENRRLDSLYKVLDEAIEFYTYAMNVDYRTIKSDKEWYKVMSKYLSTEDLDQYIESCIKNKTVVECDVVAGDRSTLYRTDTARFKIYLHFRVVSDKVIESGYDPYEDELVPVLTSMKNCSRMWLMYYMDYKVGNWIDYYVSPGVGYGYKLSKCDLDGDLMMNYCNMFPWLIKAED